MKTTFLTIWLLLSILFCYAQDSFLTTNNVVTNGFYLDFNTTSTNYQRLIWNQFTNIDVTRYMIFWTYQSNIDSGMNYKLTTNWMLLQTVSSGITNISSAFIPTNALITIRALTGSGRLTPPIPVWTNAGTMSNPNMPIITSQPAALP